MPADQLKTLAPGDDSLSSATWNTFVNVARQVQGTAGGGSQAGNPLQATVIRVRNDSGADRERFDVLGLGGPVVTPDDNLLSFLSQVCLSGVTPVAALHTGRFCVLQEPIPAGMIGRAAVAGVSVARVRGDSAAGCADATDGDPTALTFTPGGSAQVLAVTDLVLDTFSGSGSGSGYGSGDFVGERWAVVRIGNACVLPAGAEHGSGSGSGSGEGGPGAVCALCSGPTPLTWTVPLSGFTGDMAVFNGAWALAQTELPCLWEFADGTRSVFVDKLASGVRLRLYAPDGDFEVQYSGGSDDCCAEQVLGGYEVLTGSPTGSRPSSVTLHPLCGTVPCPDPCSACDAGVAPARWDADTLAGFADAGGCPWGALNGLACALTLRLGACEWQSVTGANATLTSLGGSLWQLALFATCTAFYRASFTDCCSPVVFALHGSSVDANTPPAGCPATLVLTPSGGCCPEGGGGGGGISTTCCAAAPIPTLLTATVNNVGNCPCWDGASFPITWDGVKWHGAVTVAGCGPNTLTFDLYPDPTAEHGHCLYGVVSTLDGSVSGAIVPATPSSCPPAFSWTSANFAGVVGTGCTGSGAMNITVTEP